MAAKHVKPWLIAGMLVCLVTGCSPVEPVHEATQTVTSVSATEPATERPAEPTPDPSATPYYAILSQTDQNAQGYPEAFDNRDHVLVLIPVGEFTAGISDLNAEILCSMQPPGWECSASDLEASYPAQPASISEGFWIDKYEVTFSQYRACMEAGVCEFTYFNPVIYDNFMLNPVFDEYPVVAVNWFEALTFCTQWRGGRLPTEFEWEYAARGSDGRLWPWGNELPTPDLAVYTDYQYIGEGSNDFEPVGSHESGASPFGLLDMAGNVGEWTLNWIRATDTGLQIIEGPRDGFVPLARGGAAVLPPHELSTATRIYLPGTRPSIGIANIGFRCVIPESQAQY